MPFLFYAIFINKELLVSFNNAIFSLVPCVAISWQPFRPAAGHLCPPHWRVFSHAQSPLGDPSVTSRWSFGENRANIWKSTQIPLNAQMPVLQEVGRLQAPAFFLPSMWVLCAFFEVLVLCWNSMLCHKKQFENVSINKSILFKKSPAVQSDFRILWQNNFGWMK